MPRAYNAVMVGFSIKKTVLDLIFPVRCVGCGGEGDFCCASCRFKLYSVPPTCFVCKKMVPGKGKIPTGRTCESCQKKSCIYAFLSPLRYQESTVSDLIHALKYQRVREIDGALAGILADYIARFGVKVPKGALIVPIPLHSSRKRTRGFNQAELIAWRLGERLGLSVEAEVLRKVKKTTPQVELLAEERRKNVVNTFAAPNASLVLGKTIFLLDDVKTTGATLEEAARVLKEAGAKRIWAITVAH